MSFNCFLAAAQGQGFHRKEHAVSTLHKLKQCNDGMASHCMSCTEDNVKCTHDCCLYLCRDPDFERRNSGALASPSSPASPGPFDLARLSGQLNAELQAQEEERDRLRQERMQRADRAAAAASAAVKVSRTAHLCCLGLAVERHLLAPERHLLAPEKHLLAPKRHLLAPERHLLAPERHLLAPERHLLAPERHLLAPERQHVQTTLAPSNVEWHDVHHLASSLL